MKTTVSALVCTAFLAGCVAQVEPICDRDSTVVDKYGNIVMPSCDVKRIIRPHGSENKDENRNTGGPVFADRSPDLPSVGVPPDGKDKAPDAPKLPDTPKRPDGPSAPEQPDEPEKPSAPDKPSTPNVPNESKGKEKSDNSDANGKGGNKHDREDKTKGGTERAEDKKGV